MKKLLFAVAVLVLPMTVQANERSEKEMQQIAAEQLAGSANHAKGMGASASQVAVRELAVADMYRVYGAADGNGFVVVSRDDEFTPVLGYSQTAFDEADMPSGLRWWLEKINETLQWRKANGMKVSKVAYTPTENFLTSQWGQDSPYNFLCPEVDGSVSLTGCVATALGQILYYYKYPESSIGTCGYTLDGASTLNTETLSTTYQWDKMRDTYNARFYTNSVKTPVAELLRDCGYASYMDYSPEGSGTPGYFAPAALVEHFRFQEGSVRYLQHDYCSEEEWQTIIYRELAARRPILLSGIDTSTGGHAFLLSGIDDSGKVYVNWGWRGIADGFFELTDMAPTGIQGSSETDHFNSDQEISYQISPDPTAASAQQFSQWCTYNRSSYSLTSSTSNRVTLGSTTFINFHYQSFSGDLVLLLTAANGAEYPFSLYSTTKDVYTGFTTYSQNFDLSSVPAGTYTACLASKSSKDTQYWPVRSLGGICAYTLTKEASGKITFEKTNLSTGIKTVASTPTVVDYAAYNLAGQRVSGAYKGVVIQNGRKMVRK